jgi:hypothetical protein
MGYFDTIVDEESLKTIWLIWGIIVTLVIVLLTALYIVKATSGTDGSGFKALWITTGVVGFTYLVLSMIWWFAMYSNAKSVTEIVTDLEELDDDFDLFRKK